MGWLFGKKKKPKIPLPAPADALQFPSSGSSPVAIEPAQLKEAAGVTAPPKEVEAPAKPSFLTKPQAPAVTPFKAMPVQSPSFGEVPVEGPLYIKKDVYQHMLGEIEALKSHILCLSQVTRELEESEFNEESHAEKLRKSMKLMHDKLLLVDKILFKSGGEY